MTGLYELSVAFRFGILPSQDAVEIVSKPFRLLPPSSSSPPLRRRLPSSSSPLGCLVVVG